MVYGDIYWWFLKVCVGFFMKEKSNTLKKFKKFKELVEGEVERKIQCLSDNNREE